MDAGELQMHRSSEDKGWIGTLQYLKVCMVVSDALTIKIEYAHLLLLPCGKCSSVLLLWVPYNPGHGVWTIGVCQIRSRGVFQGQCSQEFSL